VVGVVSRRLRGCPFGERRSNTVLLPDGGGLAPNTACMEPRPKLTRLLPGRREEDGFEVHRERATEVIDSRSDAFEQPLLDGWVERGVVAA
jgi:hypothetical protein